MFGILHVIGSHYTYSLVPFRLHTAAWLGGGPKHVRPTGAFLVRIAAGLSCSRSISTPPHTSSEYRILRVCSEMRNFRRYAFAAAQWPHLCPVRNAGSGNRRNRSKDHCSRTAYRSAWAVKTAQKKTHRSLHWKAQHSQLHTVQHCRFWSGFCSSFMLASQIRRKESR